jgi:hypothetical protein
MPIKMQKIKRQIKNKLKELPANIGFASIAALICLAEGGATAFDEILKGPGRGLGRSYERILRQKNFWDYYEELKELKKNSARTMLWRLEKKGLVKKKEKQYQLTVQGLKIVKIIKKEGVKKEWDGKWRMVMFDIPEKKRDETNWLRYQLVAMDYKPLQKSVFIGKEPIEEDIFKDLMNHNIIRYIRMITVGEIDDGEILADFDKFSNF